MVTAAINIKDQRVLDSIRSSKFDESEVEEELWRVVDKCLQHVSSPAHMMQLGALLKDR
jgi:hypothetical protein